ncbi:Cu(I)-responsive transcriptional regulator [Rhodovibrio sodomensis]|uniref:Cu(I)-responsive transcriptional regulator n=1 Tax=Rhodovibrio sodomensis TaxID=1088 RepID=A0ABS1DHC0_9PROT|nr:Cu(I)-responsive transcriptional regulator [Rhodovibrio sodomensis]MBK1669128.1 Cu(I)-responsive transcriptional regulator [Rhodovibrio sodomensis]
MNIGEVAKRSGVPAKTIRYYESIGLIRPAERSAAGYRIYGDRELQTLRFIQRARNLGFSVKQVGALLALWQDRARASGDVKAVARRHLDEIDRRMAELQSMRDTLEHLIGRCHGDHRPDCPILADLAGEPAQADGGSGRARVERSGADG